MTTTVGAAGPRGFAGVGYVFLAVVVASAGNVAAHRGEEGSPLRARHHRPVHGLGVPRCRHCSRSLPAARGASSSHPPNLLSLLYLAVVGAVIAFLLFYLARRRAGMRPPLTYQCSRRRLPCWSRES